MRLAGWSARFETEAGAVSVERAGAEGFATDEAAFDFSFDGEKGTVRIAARVPLRVTACAVRFAHDFAPEERVLLNGYQSWTDTVEERPWAVMRGLDGLPEWGVRRFAIDAMGDYRFTRYEERPGCRHGFTYATVRAGDRVALLASTGERRGFTLLRTDCDAGVVTFEPEAPARALAAGEEATLASFVLEEGGEDAVFDAWFDALGVRPYGNDAPLVGYTSWYRHYEDIDEGAILHDVRALQAGLAGVDVHGMGTVAFVDDGWCRKGDWLDVDAAAFPHGMAALAAEIARTGARPGLWMAPFVAERDSRLVAEHPDWLLRGPDGEPVTTGSHWSGHVALDAQSPAVRAYVEECVRTAVEDWGFSALKLDFLYAACMLPHAGMTRGELMADAVDLLRGAAGPDCVILGCGVPLASAFGVFDYCRIGCDVGLTWDNVPPAKLLHRERTSTVRSLANTVYRAPLDGRAFGCDPDVFFLRDDVRIAPARKRELLEADSLFGSMLLTSDDMGAWGPEARAAFQRAVDTLAERKRR
jgi:alpha-galactosidase